MSKRHTASRRRAYGRRQHELHERTDRRVDRTRVERAWRGPGELDFDSVGYVDAQAGGVAFGFAD